MSSYVEQAEQLAKGDGAALAEQVQALRARGFEGRELLRDGSQYSPSWRALDGGAAAWELITEARTPDGQEQVQLAYEEQLTREEEALGLSWEEGGLYFESEGYAEQRELEEARELGQALGQAEREQGAEQLYGRPSPEALGGAGLPCSGCPSPHACQYGRACREGEQA